VNNDWLDIELLEDYLDGKLDSQAMHRIEKRALEDPFVAQALAGLSESPKRASQNVSLLQKQLYDRIGQQQAAKKESIYTWQRLSIAAAAAVMFISVSIIFFIREEERRAELAKIKSQPQSIEVNIAPSPAAVDSAKADSYTANVPAKSIRPVMVGMINPKRKIEDQPVQASTAFSASAGATREDTAAVESGAILNKANARIASVLPAVSTPVGGWASLDTYIADHNKLAKEMTGKFVELSFLIDAEGSPSDIKVEKSATREFDDEAVRLIKEGPKWEQPKTEGSRVSYTVSF
jgi:TonB family protein